MKANHLPWTDERTDLLKRLWADGFSASQIAARLGWTTRNAVISKVHRLGVAERATTLQRRTPRQRPRKPRQFVPELRVKVEPHPWRVLCAPARQSVPRSETAITSTLSPYLTATFFEGTLALPDGICRWPYGDPKKGLAYCGREADGSYCLFHDRMAHRPTRPTPRINLAQANGHRENADDFNPLAGLVAASLADAHTAARTAGAYPHAIRG